MAQFWLQFSLGKDPQKDLLVHVGRRLAAHGFSVDVVAEDKGLITAQPSQQATELEASSLQLQKLNALTNKLEVFDADTRASFKDVDSPGFFEPFEQVLITEQLLEGIEADAAFWQLVNQMGIGSQAGVPEDELLIPSCRRLGVVTACSPVHEPAAVKKLWSTTRRRLFVPVEAVRTYFGEGIAFYFHWLNFQTAWLLAPALLGLWLQGRHLLVEGLHVDNDPWVPFYSAFVALWSALGLKLWERRSRAAAWHWGVSDRKRKDQIRPAFKGTVRASPITGEPERHFTKLQRTPRVLLSIVTVGAMLTVAALFIVLSFNLNGTIDATDDWFYIHAIGRHAAKGGLLHKGDANAVLAVVPAVLHAIGLIVLNGLFKSISEKLTNWENHKYEQSHTNSLVLKRFVVEAFDLYYAPLLYMALVAKDVSKVSTALRGVFMIDCVRRLMLESVIPYITSRVMQRMQAKTLSAVKASSGERPGQIEAVLDSVRPAYEPYGDYLSMVIEMGYLTLFAGAFPLGASISFVYNLIELRSDAFRLCNVVQRPTVERVGGIGGWNVLMGVQVWLSVVLNTYMMGFSSQQLLGWVPEFFTVAINDHGDMHQVLRADSAKRGLGLLLCYEHAIMLGIAAVLWLISDEPEAVRVAKARKQHQEQQLLLSAQHSRRRALLASTGALADSIKDTGGHAGGQLNARDQQLPARAGGVTAAKAWISNSNVVRRGVAAGGHGAQY